MAKKKKKKKGRSSILILILIAILVVLLYFNFRGNSIKLTKDVLLNWIEKKIDGT